jgi:hypothetical protein
VISKGELHIKAAALHECDGFIMYRTQIRFNGWLGHSAGRRKNVHDRRPPRLACNISIMRSQIRNTQRHYSPRLHVRHCPSPPSLTNHLSLLCPSCLSQMHCRRGRSNGSPDWLLPSSQASASTKQKNVSGDKDMVCQVSITCTSPQMKSNGSPYRRTVSTNTLRART